jgi:hypothetical protein
MGVMEQHRQVFIIAGMGRSGTSLVANFLQSLGVHMGDRLPAADEHNRYGYFEDLDFIYFHEQILARHGLDYFANPRQPLSLIQEEITAARDLIKAKSVRPLWGWKDPRTAFVLDFWHNELPHAHFILLFRDPIEVFLSQLKSHEWTDDPLNIIDAWVAYNDHVLKFYARYPQQSILCNLHGLLQNIGTFEALMSKKCGLNARIAQELYYSESLHHLVMPQPILKFLAKRFPDMITLYEKLQEAADIPYVPAADSFDGDMAPLLDYVCTVVHTVLKNQAREHQQLQKDYQELSELFKQKQQQHEAVIREHDTFMRDLTASETYRLAQKIQQSWLLKLWKLALKKQ